MSAATVKSSYAQIVKWLESQPDTKGILKSLNKPVDGDAIDQLKVIQKIPSQVRALYLLTGGQKDQTDQTTGLFPSWESDGLAYAFLSFKELNRRCNAEAKQRLKSEAKDGPSIPADYDWWPLAENLAGNSLVIQIDRKNKKNNGQILEFNHEEGAAILVADSLADFLEQIVTDLQSKKIYFHEDQGLSRKKNLAAAAKGKLILPPGSDEEQE